MLVPVLGGERAYKGRQGRLGVPPADFRLAFGASWASLSRSLLRNPISPGSEKLSGNVALSRAGSNAVCNGISSRIVFSTEDTVYAGPGQERSVGA